MREILEVGLKNYQSHKNTVINFESGFNVIIGASDSGKTAIKRGIESVLYNRYVSDEYIRYGEKSFSNYVLFNDGLKITREKGGRGLNKYIIDYPNGETLELNNFGTKVPDEVLNAHEMYLISLGKEIDSLNCAHQLSGPFFLQNTPGERASIIGSIAKTQVIDEAVSDTLSKHREQKKALKIFTSSNKEIEKGISAYELWIDEARDIMNKLEDDYNQLTKYNRTYETLENSFNLLEQNNIKAAVQRNIINLYQDIQIYESKLTDIIDKFNKLNMLESKFNRLDYDLNRKELLISTINKYNDIENIDNNICEIIDILKSYNSISNKIDLLESSVIQRTKLENIIESYKGTDEIITELNELEKMIFKYNNLNKKIENLTTLLTRKQKGEVVIKNLNDSLQLSIKKYQDMLDALGKCPTCYSIMTDEQLENIKNNLA